MHFHLLPNLVEDKKGLYSNRFPYLSVDTNPFLGLELNMTIGENSRKGNRVRTVLGIIE